MVCVKTIKGLKNKILKPFIRAPKRIRPSAGAYYRLVLMDYGTHA